MAVLNFYDPGSINEAKCIMSNVNVNICILWHSDSPSSNDTVSLLAKIIVVCFRMDDNGNRMFRLSLIISGPREGCTYKREDVLPGLQKVVEGKLGSYIISFGPLANNTEWHLVVKDQATKDKFSSLHNR